MGRPIPTVSLYPAAAAFPKQGLGRRPHWTFEACSTFTGYYGLSARCIAYYVAIPVMLFLVNSGGLCDSVVVVLFGGDGSFLVRRAEKSISHKFSTYG